MTQLFWCSNMLPWHKTRKETTGKVENARIMNKLFPFPSCSWNILLKDYSAQLSFSSPSYRSFTHHITIKNFFFSSSSSYAATSPTITDTANTSLPNPQPLTQLCILHPCHHLLLVTPIRNSCFCKQEHKTFHNWHHLKGKCFHAAPDVFSKSSLCWLQLAPAATS